MRKRRNCFNVLFALEVSPNTRITNKQQLPASISAYNNLHTNTTQALSSIIPVILFFLKKIFGESKASIIPKRLR